MSVGLSVHEKKRNIYFQDGRHLRFPIGTILTIVGLQVTLMLPTEFQVNWPIDSGEEEKMDFQEGRHGGQLRFPMGTILAIFIYKLPRCFLPSFKSPKCFTKFHVNWPFASGEEAKNRFSRWRL